MPSWLELAGGWLGLVGGYLGLFLFCLGMAFVMAVRWLYLLPYRLFGWGGR